MITEDYVSFDTAKLLKEKGFDCKKESITAMYNEDGEFYSLSSADYYYYDYNDFDENDYICPTIQMAMKWLREVKDIYIDVTSRFSFNADKDVCFSYSIKQLVDKYKSNSIANEDGEWLTYEETCETAIKYCLENLI